MSEWIKVFPSQAGIRFVSVADADSPTGFSLVEETASEIKTALGIEPHYRVIQFLSGNGSTVINSNPNLFTNEIPNSIIDTDWTKVGTGIYRKTISSTGNPFTGDDFSSRIFTDDGVVFDISVAEAAIGFYRAQIIWTGSIWQIELYLANLSGAYTDLYFYTDPLTINIGLNPA